MRAMIATILLLVVIGVLLELMKTYVAVDPAILTVIRLIVLVFVVLLVLRLFGVVDVPLLRAR